MKAHVNVHLDDGDVFYSRSNLDEPHGFVTVGTGPADPTLRIFLTGPGQAQSLIDAATEARDLLATGARS